MILKLPVDTINSVGILNHLIVKCFLLYVIKIQFHKW